MHVFNQFDESEKKKEKKPQEFKIFCSLVIYRTRNPLNLKKDCYCLILNVKIKIILTDKSVALARHLAARGVTALCHRPYVARARKTWSASLQKVRKCGVGEKRGRVNERSW